MTLRTEIGLRIAVSALLLGAAAWVVLTFFLAPADDDDPMAPPAPDPAAYQVAEVIEEARRITRDAAG